MKLTAERARELLAYDKSRGTLTWRVDRGRYRAGTDAGSVHPSEGRLFVKIDQKTYAVPRVIWLIVNGEWPQQEIDHRDGDVANNRWRNLRDVTGVTNRQNQRRPRRDSILQLQGVRRRNDGKFQARITVAGKQKSLGLFTDQNEAHAEYLRAKRDLHEGCTL